MSNRYLAAAIQMEPRLGEKEENNALLCARVEEAARSGVDAETVQKSTDLVLRTKAERVNDWYDKEYGTTTRTVRRNYASGGYRAASAGYAAGKSADIWQPRVGGKREIGR